MEQEQKISGQFVFWGGLALIIVVTLMVYCGAWQYNFVTWDDPIHVSQNPYYPPQRLGDLGVFWRQSFEACYLPVDFTVWGVLAYFFGGSANPGSGNLPPAPFHILNVATHILSILLVALLMRRLKIGPAGTLFGAAIFALHPLQSEAVSWVSAFKELNGLFLSLITLHLYLSASEGKHFWPLTVAGGLASVLATLAHPMTAGFSVAALLMIENRSRRDIFVPAFWVLFGAVIAVVTRTVQPLDPDSVVPPLYLRPAIAGDSLMFYLWKLVWPFGYGIDYGRTPAYVLSHSAAPLLSLVPVAAVATLLFLWKRDKPLARLLTLFLAVLTPMLGLIPFSFQMYSTVADRYFYAPMLGLCMAAGLLFDRAFARVGKLAPGLAGIALAACLFLGYRTTLQSVVWYDSVALLENALKINPQSWGSENNLALVFIQSDNLPAALDHADRAIQIKPKLGQAWLNKATILLRQEHYRASRDCYQKVVELRPDISDGYYGLAIVAYSQGEKHKALGLLDQALQRQPDFQAAIDLRRKVEAIPG